MIMPKQPTKCEGCGAPNDEDRQSFRYTPDGEWHCKGCWELANLLSVTYFLSNLRVEAPNFHEITNARPSIFGIWWNDFDEYIAVHPECCIVVQIKSDDQTSQP